MVWRVTGPSKAFGHREGTTKKWFGVSLAPPRHLDIVMAPPKNGLVCHLPLQGIWTS